MTIDTAALRKIAEASAPGPWHYDMGIIFSDAGLPGGCQMKPSTYRLADIRGWGHLSYREDGEALQKGTGEYIATFHPQVVLALLDAADRLAAVEASVGTIVAEQIRLRQALAATGRELGGAIADDVSTDFLCGIQLEARAKMERIAALTANLAAMEKERDALAMGLAVVKAAKDPVMPELQRDSAMASNANMAIADAYSARQARDAALAKLAAIDARAYPVRSDSPSPGQLRRYAAEFQDPAYPMSTWETEVQGAMLAAATLIELLRDDNAAMAKTWGKLQVERDAALARADAAEKRSISELLKYTNGTGDAVCLEVGEYIQAGASTVHALENMVHVLWGVIGQYKKADEHLDANGITLLQKSAEVAGPDNYEGFSTVKFKPLLEAKIERDAAIARADTAAALWADSTAKLIAAESRAGRLEAALIVERDRLQVYCDRPVTIWEGRPATPAETALARIKEALAPDCDGGKA